MMMSYYQYFAPPPKKRKKIEASLPNSNSDILAPITGILNTTVNFTYQFLRKKFAIFSQVNTENHHDQIDVLNF